MNSDDEDVFDQIDKISQSEFMPQNNNNLVMDEQWHQDGAEQMREAIAAEEDCDMISVGDNAGEQMSADAEGPDIADIPDIDNEDALGFEDDMQMVGAEIDNHLGIVDGVRLNQDGRPRKTKKNKKGFLPGEPQTNRGLTGQKKFGPNLYAPKDLNFLQFFVRDKFKDILSNASVTDFRMVPQILNQEYCETILKFYFVIDTVPELNWDDGSQYMTLRCGKHLSTEAEKYQLGGPSKYFVKRYGEEAQKKMKEHLQRLGISAKEKEKSGNVNDDSSQESLEDYPDLKEKCKADMEAQCKLILKLKTNSDGFWILNESCDAFSNLNTLYHDPPLVACSSYYKKLRERQRGFQHSTMVDSILQQSVNQLWDNPKNDFEAEFETDKKMNDEMKALVMQKEDKESLSDEEVNNEKYKQLIKISKNEANLDHLESIFDDDFGKEIIESRPPIDPSLAPIQIKAPVFQIPSFDEDPFTEKPVIKEPLPPNKEPEKPPEPEMKLGTIKVSENVQVNVIDSRSFQLGSLNTFGQAPAESSDKPKLQVNVKSFKQKKKPAPNFIVEENTSTKPSSNEHSAEAPESHFEKKDSGDNPDEQKAEVCENLGWFINEDDRLKKGADFATKEDDMYKLIKHLKNIFGKGDMYRYLTADNKQTFFPDTHTSIDQPLESKHLVQSLVFSTQQMKENYHIHRDILFICPLTKERHDNRFGMMGIVIYGVNSHGRNVVYGFGFINDSFDELQNFEFIFQQFNSYMEKQPRVVLMSRIIATGNSENLFTAINKTYGKRCGSNWSPYLGETQMVFCPYALYEELKDKFQFLQRDEKFLFNVILSLPFETDKLELDQNLRELIRLDFKQLENLRELFSKLNKSKEMWSRAFLLQRSNPFIGDLSLFQRNEVIESIMQNHLVRSSQYISPADFLKQLKNIEKVDYNYNHELRVNNIKQLSEGQEEVLQGFIVPNFSKHVYLRSKFNLLKSQLIRVVLNPEEDTFEFEEEQKASPSKPVKTWVVQESNLPKLYKVKLMITR